MNTQDLLPGAIEHLRRLVAFDTVSHNSNLELIEYVRAFLLDHGIESRLYPDPTGRKANLVAWIGPKDQSGIIWSGHTDVVPVCDQTWTSDPFTLTESNGRLAGRGTTDMKGFLACCLALVPELCRTQLFSPVILVFSYDEEIGCVGVRSVIDDIQFWRVAPHGCIVGEPTGMRLVTGHKAKRSIRAHVAGSTAHSSLAPHAVNAVYFASKLVVKIHDISDRLACQGPQDNDFSVPFSTAHVGVIRGGTQLNIVPDLCSFDFEFRVLPDQDADALVREVTDFAVTTLVPKMKSVCEAANIDFETIGEIPGLSINEADDWVVRMKRISEADGIVKVPFGAEAGLFQVRAGVPTVICGPGEIDDAHKADESIAVEQLARCVEILSRSVSVAR